MHLSEADQAGLKPSPANGSHGGKPWPRLQAAAVLGVHTAPLRVTAGNPVGSAGKLHISVTLAAAPPLPGEVHLPAV